MVKSHNVYFLKHYVFRHNAYFIALKSALFTKTESEISFFQSIKNVSKSIPFEKKHREIFPP